MTRVVVRAVYGLSSYEEGKNEGIQFCFPSSFLLLMPRAR